MLKSIKPVCLTGRTDTLIGRPSVQHFFTEKQININEKELVGVGGSMCVAGAAREVRVSRGVAQP